MSHCRIDPDRAEHCECHVREEIIKKFGLRMIVRSVDTMELGAYHASSLRWTVELDLASPLA
jgi:hypothetical protein